MMGGSKDAAPVGPTKTQMFTYDAVFDEDSRQSDVYNALIKRVVDQVMDGFNGTIFAFGQTSSGKTFTMMGPDSQPVCAVAGEEDEYY
jgi:hypothetical protein